MNIDNNAQKDLGKVAQSRLKLVALLPTAKQFTVLIFPLQCTRPTRVAQCCSDNGGAGRLKDVLGGGNH